MFVVEQNNVLLKRTFLLHIKFCFVTQFQIARNYGDSDFTGARVTSDKPIFVQSGAKQGSVGTDSFIEHLAEHLPLVSSLGTTYLIVPYGGRFSRVRIVGKSTTGKRSKTRFLNFTSILTHLICSICLEQSQYEIIQPPLMLIKYTTRLGTFYWRSG